MLKRILLSIILIFYSAIAVADIARIDIVIPADNTNLRDFSQKIQTALQQQQPNLNIVVHTRADLDAPPSSANALLIAVGDSLSTWALSPQNKYAASIAFYVNSAGLAANRFNPNTTALYRDQPLTRQLRLAKLLFPKLQHVAILQGEQPLAIGREQLQRLTGLSFAIATMHDEDWAKSLSQLMVDNDLLLGLDDPQMYNSDSIHRILLTTYRHGKVLIGPSKPFVGAGSLASCYTTTDQYLQQLVDIVKAYLQTDKLPAPQYPKAYQITLNQQVAASLGLTIPDESTLYIRMHNTAEECGDDC